MRLKSVTIYGNDFRSLTVNRKYEFNVNSRTDRLSTKCFAGLNGSGKSNMLELIAEIFYYLEYEQILPEDERLKLAKGFGFEIEYQIPLREVVIAGSKGTAQLPDSFHNWYQVRVQKFIDALPEYASKKIELANTTKLENSYERLSGPLGLYLPAKILAYTSGQNEQLSNPFYKLKYHYYKEVERFKNEAAAYDRMHYIDSTHNFNVFIANYLLGDERKLVIMKRAYKITGLNSFRITINRQNWRASDIDFFGNTENIIQRLLACATSWDIRQVYGTKKRAQYVIDFLVNESTRNAFKYHFGSAMDLYRELYQLEMLNLHMHQKQVRDLINDGPKWLNISDEIPVIDPNQQIYRLEKIYIDKVIDQESNTTKPIYYKSLSDGEHQFNEIIGTMLLIDSPGSLILLDEPDTHFNPKWRAKLIKLLNEMAATEWDDKGRITKVCNQEVIMTTHSPFAISDSYREDVYVFEKTKQGVRIENPKIKTYGASIGMILENIFNRDASISDFANEEIEELKEKTRSINQINKAKESLNDFGESIEKFDAISYIIDKELAMEKRAKDREKKKGK